MFLCVLCDRLFGSEQALEQHQRDSPIHIRTVHCELCDRFFGSEQALKQHQQCSPMHTGTYCKACNRTFGSNKALKQHQHDSPVHQQKSPKVASSTVIPTFDLDSSLLPNNTRAEVRERNHQRNSQTPSKNTSDLDFSRYRPSLTPENHPRVFTISVREPTIKLSQISTIHVLKRKEETRTSFTFPELHDKVAEAVLPEVTSVWFQSNDREGYNNEYSTCVVGSFTCDNRTCKKRSWVSGVVAILMRGYARNGYSAVVFN
jgi:ribosomal protein S26